MSSKKELKEAVAKISKGVFNSLVDLALFYLFCGQESLTDPKFLRFFAYSQKKGEQIWEEITVMKMRRSLYYIKKKGWVDERLKINALGKQKMENILLPSFKKPLSWNGNWYLVNFDIPEKISWKRDILRENLKKLGFAKLQNSVWISPNDFLGNIQQIVKTYKLEPYVIFSVSPKVGPLQAKKLAKRIWPLEELDKEYKNFIKKYGRVNRQDKTNLSFEIIGEYCRIFKKTPFLPKDLWPQSDFDKAFKIYSHYLKSK